MVVQNRYDQLAADIQDLIAKRDEYDWDMDLLKYFERMIEGKKTQLRALGTTNPVIKVIGKTDGAEKFHFYLSNVSQLDALKIFNDFPQKPDCQELCFEILPLKVIFYPDNTG